MEIVKERRRNGCYKGGEEREGMDTYLHTTRGRIL
jgi:hypothetical protein